MIHIHLNADQQGVSCFWPSGLHLTQFCKSEHLLTCIFTLKQPFSALSIACRLLFYASKTDESVSSRRDQRDRIRVWTCAPHPPSQLGCLDKTVTFQHRLECQKWPPASCAELTFSCTGFGCCYIILILNKGERPQALSGWT